MATVDLDAIKAEWIGVTFDEITFQVDAERIVNWAIATGEDDPRFIDPNHPDFQAHPAFATHFGARRWVPEGFPQFGNGNGIDGGKSIEMHAAIHSGDVLTATSKIADIYDKTGRSGTMVFIVHRLEFVNQDGVHVATVDTRQIRSMGN